MPSSTNIPADVREAIGAFMDHAQDNNHTLALTEALKANNLMPRGAIRWEGSHRRKQNFDAVIRVSRR